MSGRTRLNSTSYLQKQTIAIGFAKRLRNNGAYGLTRNSMYFRVNSVFWGIGFLLDSVHLLLGESIWSIFNFLIVTLWEEKQMKGKFGDEYLEYKEQVPRFINIRLKRKVLYFVRY
jgi:protein-S-isoprenylcysteine O-methyltransferase Ste14